jgi:hypothetical protein
LPAIPLCPDVHITCTFLHSVSIIRDFMQSQTDFEIIYKESSAFNADFLSDGP